MNFITFIYILLSTIIFGEVIIDEKSGLFFSPNYDGIEDKIYIEQSGSIEKIWIGQFSDYKSNVIKTFKWSNASPKDISWDGKNDYGRVANNGRYIYTHISRDENGKILEKSKNINITIDDSTPKVKIKIDKNYISPNKDSVNDFATLNITTVVKQKIKKTIYDNNK